MKAHTIKYPENVEVISFPAGETHVRLNILDDDFSNIILRSRIKNSTDLVNTLLCCHVIYRETGIEPILYLPYLPYGRQDRVAVRGESLSIQTILNLFDKVHVCTIITVDAHSDVAEAIWNRQFVNISVIQLVQQFIAENNLQDYILLLPDAGAYKKSAKLIQAIGPSIVKVCEKTRDPINGNIIINVPNLPDKPVLIVDDIYDGGGTFKLIAGRLTNKPYLFVTHGIFSKGTDDLENYFTKVGTTDTYRTDLKPSDTLRVYTIPDP